MSTRLSKCPFSTKCPQNVRKMSGKNVHMSRTAQSKALSGSMFTGVLFKYPDKCPNVHTMSKCPHFETKMSQKCPHECPTNHPATYLRPAARFVRWPGDIADEERLHVSRCPQLSPRHHVLPVYSVDWRRSSASKALCRGSCALFQCPNVKGP